MTNLDFWASEFNRLFPERDPDRRAMETITRAFFAAWKPEPVVGGARRNPSKAPPTKSKVAPDIETAIDTLLRAILRHRRSRHRADKNKPVVLRVLDAGDLLAMSRAEIEISDIVQDSIGASLQRGLRKAARRYALQFYSVSALWMTVDRLCNRGPKMIGGRGTT
jgi:hypothetical protein